MTLLTALCTTKKRKVTRAPRTLSLRPERRRYSVCIWYQEHRHSPYTNPLSISTSSSTSQYNTALHIPLQSQYIALHYITTCVLCLWYYVHEYNGFCAHFDGICHYDFSLYHPAMLHMQRELIQQKHCTRC